MPPGFVVRYLKGPSVYTFVVNFVALIPLAIKSEQGVEEMSIHLSETWGNLIYITLRYLASRVRELYADIKSNTVQLVSSILLLTKGDLDVLKTNLIGGILSSVLLVLGVSVLIGGLTRIEQGFHRKVGQSISQLSFPGNL